MPTATYDPKAIAVSFAGKLISGFADGTMLTAERNDPIFSTVVGSAGEVARVRSRNQTGKIVLTLMQTSLSNAILTALAALDELSGLGQGPLLIKDLNGTTLLDAPNAWISKLPSVEFGKDLSNREWELACDVLNMNVGGNV